jgi:hypothetical protein
MGTLAKVGFADRRILPDLHRDALRNNPASVEHNDMIRNAHHQLHVVFDQHHANPGLGNLSQQLAEALGVLRSQASSRLIQQEHPRLCRQGPGDFHHSRVDMGEPRRRAIQRPIVPDESQEALGKLYTLALALHAATYGNEST